VRRRAALTLPLLAVGCAQSPPSREQALPALPSLLDQAPPAGGRLWKADATASLLRIVAFRGGAAARLGHHHILQAEDFKAALWLPDSGLAGAQGELRVRLDALQIDAPAWRAAAGGEFNEKPVGPEAIAGTRSNLLKALEAAAHPEVRLQLLNLSGAAPWWIAALRLNLAGRAADYRVALAVAQTPERLRLQGRIALRHSDHGLAAFSLLGGLLAVQDGVVLELDLQLR